MTIATKKKQRTSSIYFSGWKKYSEQSRHTIIRVCLTGRLLRVKDKLSAIVEVLILTFVRFHRVTLIIKVDATVYVKCLIINK